MWQAFTYAAIVSCVGCIGSGVISSPISTSSKYTALPPMCASLPRRPRFASDLRLLHDGHFLALLVLVRGLTDDEHHLARAARLFIHVGDSRLQGNGIARPHRRVEFATLAGIERYLAELHFRVWHLVGTEHIIENWRGYEAAAGGLLSGLRVDVLRAGFADGVRKRQHHLRGDLKRAQHELLTENAAVEFDHDLALLFASALDPGLLEGDGTVATRLQVFHQILHGADRASEFRHKFADGADEMGVAAADAEELALGDELLSAGILLPATTTVELFGGAQRAADVIAVLEMFDEPDVPPARVCRD